jgi:signal transduction histidine kinase
MSVGSPPLVLIVDDDEIDRRVASRFLGPGYRSRLFSSGEEVLAAIDGDPPDCAVIDFQIPGTDTMQLVTELVSRSIAVVMLTGHGSEPVAVQTMQLGASDYLSKHQLTETALGRAVSNAIEKNRMAIQLRDKQREIAWFAGVAAHDLRAPLRRLCQYADLAMLQGGRADPELSDIITSMRKDARSLLTLVDGLSNYMKAGRLGKKLTTVNLARAAEMALDNLDVLRAERSATVDIGPLPNVIGDEIALVQLLQNLIANGIKYCVGKPPVIRVGAERGESETMIRLWVADNGPGIPDGRREDIFQPFSRLNVNSEVDGSGLGLAICRRIADQHHGKIWVEENPGGGSLFCFTLHAAPDAAPGRQMAVKRAVVSQKSVTESITFK